jgi:hypothetical protein
LPQSAAYDDSGALVLFSSIDVAGDGVLARWNYRSVTLTGLLPPRPPTGSLTPLPPGSLQAPHEGNDDFGVRLPSTGEPAGVGSIAQTFRNRLKTVLGAA